MKGKFNKIFTVTAVLLGICCLAMTPAKVKANAFDTVKTNVSQTRKTTTKKVKLSSKAKKNKTTTSTRKKLQMLIVHQMLPLQFVKRLKQQLLLKLL